MNNQEQERSESQPSPKPRSYCQDGFWFLQLAEDVILGPFERVYDVVMADRNTEEKELDSNEFTRFMLQFA